MTTIFIEGMHCEKCVARVTASLKEVEGVSNVTVELNEKKAVVEGSVDKELLRAAVEETGFEVVSIE